MLHFEGNSPEYDYGQGNHSSQQGRYRHNATKGTAFAICFLRNNLDPNEPLCSQLTEPGRNVPAATWPLLSSC